MTRMHATVTGPSEAEIALVGGADLIEVALDRGGLAALRDTVAAVAGSRAVRAVATDKAMLG